MRLICFVYVSCKSIWHVLRFSNLSISIYLHFDSNKYNKTEPKQTHVSVIFQEEIKYENEIQRDRYMSLLIYVSSAHCLLNCKHTIFIIKILLWRLRFVNINRWSNCFQLLPCNAWTKWFIGNELKWPRNEKNLEISEVRT